MSRRELLNPISTHVFQSETGTPSLTPDVLGSKRPRGCQDLSEPELTLQHSLSSTSSDATTSSDSNSRHPDLCEGFLFTLHKLSLHLNPQVSEMCERCLSRFQQGSAHAREHGGRLEYVAETQSLVYVCEEGHEWSADMKKVRKDRWCAACAREERREKKAKHQAEDETRCRQLAEEQQELFREAADLYKDS